MEALLPASLIASVTASPILSVIVSILVAIVAFKVAFFTIKRVVTNAVLGVATYWVCANILHIPMDTGIVTWVLTGLLGPIPMVISALYHGLLK